MLKYHLFFAIAFSIFTHAHGQEGVVNVQVKVYDLELNPYPSIGIVINNLSTFKTDEKGKAFTTVPKASLPPTSIEISDNKLEAESWNYSKGILERQLYLLQTQGHCSR